MILLMVNVSASNAQPEISDSLRAILQNSRDDSSKVKRLMFACRYLPFNQPDSGLYYADSIIRLSEKIDYGYGKAIGYFQKGYSYSSLGDYSQAILYSHQSLRMHAEIGDLSGSYPAFETLAYVHEELGDYKKALEYQLQIREVLLSLGDSAYNRYYSQITPTAGNIAVNDYHIAIIYLQMGKVDSALKYGTLAFSYWQQKWSSAPVVMGDIFFAKGDYPTALNYYRMPIFGRIHPLDSVKNFIGRANVFQKMKEEDSCRWYAEKGLGIARRLNYAKGIMQASEILSHVYERTDPQESVKFLRLSMAIKDSLYSKGRVNQVNSIAFNDELRKLDTIAAEKAARNRFKIWSLFGGMFTLLVTGLLLWRNNRHKKKTNLLLQTEKQTVEQTLERLKSTQSQLIQSEKMASLGELTAGIAHEIQNPLNFVNNFSEVNRELIEELKNEKSKIKSERDDGLEKQLLNDIEQNLEKINHHGKRAEAIVKGMLQHSRSSSGQKEPTDINALADEYARLAYHGLRAKDKAFNATLKTDFDETIGVINIIPQDIGRVILNLINNAFYAVVEKKKQNSEGYEPVVSLTTKRLNDKVEIKVGDNGNGIPEKLLAKIFQPFFTTKPTGQGTGLGLSLAYDIVKAHGGELKVESKQGDGANFKIELPL